jgi:hypothetical protein
MATVNVTLATAGASQTIDFSPYAHGPRGSLPITAVNGVFTVDTSVVDLGKLIDAGFQIAPTVVSTANRPNSPFPGQEVFDSTLGYPIWRNAANSAWVSATGATV